MDDAFHWVVSVFEAYQLDTHEIYNWDGEWEPNASFDHGFCGLPYG